ncbi:MAG: sigma-70 family RNA polymerase sigma factor [Chloroflexi bacterium]|nr:sigma-70 family RNA polymerase sigma factor [Chloroflexota bacterium]MDA1239535.1 sigma-70 family RNA polymerase sigma factor [Chloroflexota bacterium]
MGGAEGQAPVQPRCWRPPTTQSRRPDRSGRPPRTRDERDEALARRALEDRSAFSALYEAHASRVYRYLLSRTSDPAEAEELTSRVFLRALAGLDQYKGRGAGFSSWLMSIAHNLLVNWYRDRGRRPTTAALDAAMDVASEVPGPESSLEQNERIAQVRGAISSLSADRQELIALKYVDGRTNAEIGRMMGRTEGAVKALHHRTLRELHALLADLADDAEAGRGRERAR